jgi:putative ABC transport system permease protein
MSHLTGHIKVVLRKLYREKLYAFINLAGLSLAVACCLILALYLQDELGYDRHFENHENIYRIVEEFDNQGNLDAFARTGFSLGYLMKQDFAEVVDYVAFTPLPSIMMRHGDDGFFWDSMYRVTPNVFDVFSHEIVFGDPDVDLSERRGIAVSETFAKRYFGDENPVGEIMTSDVLGPMPIALVFADLPENTHLKYDLLLPVAQTAATMGSIFQQQQQLWQTPSFTYLLMEDGFDPASFEQMGAQFFEQHMSQVARLQGVSMRYWLEPLAYVHLFSGVQRDRPGGNLAYVYAFGAIAIFIMVLACINYTNLATARSVKWAKEVGMRKILGASRVALMAQFLMEAFFFALLATVLGVVIVEVVLELTSINQLLGKSLTLDLFGDPRLLGATVLFALFLGVLSGIYPAFYLSSWAPIASLVSSNSAGRRNVYLRKGLVMLQFTISIATISGTLLMAKQMRYLSDLDLGFARENRIVIDLVGADLIQDVPIIREALLKNPNVLAVASHEQILGRLEDMRSASVQNNEGENEPVTINVSRVDGDFLDAMGISIVSGRGLSDRLLTDTGKNTVVNEAFVRYMGWDEPIGKTIFDSQNGQLRVVGVMQDTHFQSLRNVIDPLAYVLFDDDWDAMGPQQRAVTRRYLTVNVAGEGIRDTLDFIEDQFEAFDPRYPFQFRFLDESLDELYRSEDDLMKLIAIFAGVSVFIACLGLFGLASFTTEQRRREFSIRKVLGASPLQIVQLVSGNVFLLVLIGGIAGSVAAYFAIDDWLLGFAYHTSIGFAAFAIAIVAALCVAYVTVALQSFRFAQNDPVDALRYE